MLRLLSVEQCLGLDLGQLQFHLPLRDGNLRGNTPGRDGVRSQAMTQLPQNS